MTHRTQYLLLSAAFVVAAWTGIITRQRVQHRHGPAFVVAAWTGIITLWPVGCVPRAEHRGGEMSLPSLPSWARVGAKVVCVDADGLVMATNGRWYPKSHWPLVFPEPQAIYTIREALVHENGSPACRLVEIDNSHRLCRGGVEFCFQLSRFRPLITIEDDIATHFRQHLDVREPVGV